MGKNSMIVPFDYKTAVVQETFRKYKIKMAMHEKLLFYNEVVIKKNISAQVVLTNIKFIHFMVS